MTMLGLFNHYGYDEQLLQLCEEQGELIQALNKYRRYKDKCSEEELRDLRTKIIEEMGDVWLVTKQFMVYLNIDELDVNKAGAYKFEREIERIKENV